MEINQIWKLAQGGGEMNNIRFTTMTAGKEGGSLKKGKRKLQKNGA